MHGRIEQITCMKETSDAHARIDTGCTHVIDANGVQKRHVYVDTGCTGVIDAHEVVSISELTAWRIEKCKLIQPKTQRTANIRHVFFSETH